MIEVAAIALVALVVGLAIGWFVARREVAALQAERDQRTEEFKRAIVDLAAASERAKAAEGLRAELETMRRERDEARTEVTRRETEAAAFETRLAEFKAAKDDLAGRFREVAGNLLGEAQKAFLERADERFRQSEESAGQGLRALLQPVTERLQRYEEGVAKVEAERRDAFGTLYGQIEAMRVGQESVRAEAQKLVNALRAAPKARGRWGEQQLRNVLETCGLAEHTDFALEVSVTGDDGERLRPDAVVRVPGGKSLVIDAKVSLNAYQDAFAAVDEQERQIGLTAHANAMRAHVNTLGAKAYWSQFPDAPDYVIMFVPGEHFLSAALEHDPTLWDAAFDKRVLLATPTNLIAIARTVSAVWRQERLATEARQIGALGKELYDRLAKAVGDLRVVGSGLNTAVKNYNGFVASFESRALVSARKLRDLNIEPGAREIETISPVELLAGHAEDESERPLIAE
ncbi:MULTISPECIES: DNA recombination protein RmuC [Sphingomonas]|uniref:DNA recombination protein RmuC n=1 Tax=Sphingomonas TaxID=13687 RepID=UPI00092970C3|nr:MULTISPECIES: DNA recombination protein RmuC [Sphingomonas]MCW6529699.1 DNA recombination protein RmuC [Sphingomonas lycopersici]OJU20052.1 MAG: recombinase RmuC [Sphingomonas sp. 66-10]